MIAESLVAGELLEATMLVCFGLSWPIDIVKAIRTKRTEGKSLAFMAIIAVGYCFGVAAKFSRMGAGERWPEPVTLLYALNAILVSVDIALFLRYRPRGRPAEAVENGERRGWR